LLKRLTSNGDQIKALDVFASEPFLKKNYLSTLPLHFNFVLWAALQAFGILQLYFKSTTEKACAKLKRAIENAPSG
jgi:hypothetical protein